MENKKSLKINILLTVLFALFTLNTVLRHEIWADEAQVWLLVKYLSPAGLLKHLVNEGHPSFFYFLVMPFAKMNFSIMAMQIICWLGTVFGAFLILQFSPFSKFAKFSILTGGCFLYFFPVIARSYSILPFLVTAAAYLYPKSKERPYLYAIVLALIANTHVIMFGFSGILGCIFLYDNFIKPFKTLTKNEKIKFGAAFGVVFAGLLAVVLQLKGTSSSNSCIGLNFDYIGMNVYHTMLEFFTNVIDNTAINMAPVVSSAAMMKTYQASWAVVAASLVLLALTFLSVVIFALVNVRAFLTVAVGIGFQLFVYIFAYSAFIYPNRIGTAYLIMIFAFWMVLSDANFKEKYRIITKKSLNIILALMFLVTIMNGVRYTIGDLTGNYSSAKVTAQFIQKNIPENALLITTQDPFSLGLYYYLPKNRMWSIMQRKYINYVVWDKSLLIGRMQKDWSLIVRRRFSEEMKHQPIYVVTPSYDFGRGLEIFNKDDWKMIYLSPPSIAYGEGFAIYKFTGR